MAENNQKLNSQNSLEKSKPILKKVKGSDLQTIKNDFNALKDSHDSLLEQNKQLETRLREVEQKLDTLNDSLSGVLKASELKKVFLQLAEIIPNPESHHVDSSKTEPSSIEPGNQHNYEYQLKFNRSESRKVLKQALQQAEKRLILVCPWLTSWATAILIENCERLLKREVQIDIGWGSLEQLAKEQTDDSLWYGALPTLIKLQNKYPDLLQLKKLGTHEKYLVCDESFAMLGSHNFLTSNSSSPEFETGIFTTDVKIIRELIYHFDSCVFDKDAALDYLSREQGLYNLTEQPVEVDLIKKTIDNLQKNIEVLSQPQVLPKIIAKPGTSISLKTRNNDPINAVSDSQIITQRQQDETDIVNAGFLENILESNQVDYSTSTNKHGEIIVNLNWNQGQQIPNNNGKEVDLDLRCLYELTTGEKLGVEALGKRFGNFNESPYIELCGDDRTGYKFPEGEILRINGDKLAEFKRILIYASIYKGVANWQDIDGVITIKALDVAEQSDIEIKLDNSEDGKNVCAIALIKNNGNNFEIKRQVKYFSRAEEMDKDFKWGLNWVAGSKD